VEKGKGDSGQTTK